MKKGLILKKVYPRNEVLTSTWDHNSCTLFKEPTSKKWFQLNRNCNLIQAVILLVFVLKSKVLCHGGIEGGKAIASHSCEQTGLKRDRNSKTHPCKEKRRKTKKRKENE